MNMRIGLQSLVAFVAAYALCLGIAPIVKLSPMFVGIGTGLAYFVYQKMSVEEFYYEEEDEMEDEKSYSAPPETLLGAYERSTAKAQNNVLEHLWKSGEMQDFLQMKGCYAPTGMATTAVSTAEVNDALFDFDDDTASEAVTTVSKDEDGLILPVVDDTPARPDAATAIDENDDFDLYEDELESASIVGTAIAETVPDDEDEDSFFDDSLLIEDEHSAPPQESQTEE